MKMKPSVTLHYWLEFGYFMVCGVWDLDILCTYLDLSVKYKVWFEPLLVRPV